MSPRGVLFSPVNNNDLLFADDTPAAGLGEVEPWIVLVVDDDPDIHNVTRMMFRNARFHGRPVTMLSAYSAKEARALLAAQPDTALILLDVVMESEHAGLDFVTHIREVERNDSVRIVLRTGQPGSAPEQLIVTRYSIDDYLTKADLTYTRLNTVLSTTLRTYSLLKQLEAKTQALANANQELEKLAHTDALTGLLNRHLFNFSLDREWRLAMRNSLPVTAFMIDIDYFKRYNDTYGHRGGDEALVAVSRAIARRASRAGDLVCRYGGEEFVLICLDMSYQDGLALAEMIRKEVADLGIPHAGSPIGIVTVSTGVSGVVTGRHSAAKGYIELMDQADQALYRSKGAGRNRVQGYTAADARF